MAINPIHVRSGNMISDDADEFALVTDIALADPLFADYNGVPLTEQMLFAFGLREINGSGWWRLADTNMNLKFYPNTPSDLNTAEGFVRPGFHSTDTVIGGVKIQYAHTLMNYVQAATGVELDATLAMAL